MTVTLAQYKNVSLTASQTHKIYSHIIHTTENILLRNTHNREYTPTKYTKQRIYSHKIQTTQNILPQNTDNIEYTPT